MSLRLLATVALLLASVRLASAGHGHGHGHGCDNCDNCFPHCGRHAHSHHDYHNREARMRAQGRPWHGRFYHTMWGQPVALVVPPTAEYESNYGWGVLGTSVTPIDHQFGRNYPGRYAERRYGFLGTPQWPSDTRQFGVYYVRGPW